MDKSQKTRVVEELKSSLESASIVLVAINSGVTVSASRDLRKQVKAAKCNYKVYKNRLAKIAIDGSKCDPLKELLKGPTALAYANDVVAISKILINFSKENEKLQIAGGVMDGRLLSANDVKQLASLPSLDELRGKIVGLLQAPASKLAAVLQAPALQLARVTKAYAEKK